MSLKIGQVSMLFDLSVETIRYYEKENILDPARTESSSYRNYDIWNIFELAECLKYRSMEFSVKEVRQMMHYDGLELLSKRLSGKCSVLEDEIIYKSKLLKHLESLGERIESAKYNIGNYWFKKEKEIYYVKCCERSGKDYSDFNCHDDVLKSWLNTKPFYKTLMHVAIDDISGNVEQDFWSIALEKEYFEYLELPLSKEVQVMNANTYLHTVIDLGDKDELSIKMLEPSIEYLKSHKLTTNGDIIGELLVRFHENDKWFRYVEVIIPVKTM